MSSVTLQKASFEGNLLFEDTPLFLKSDIPDKIKIKYSSESKTFSVFIDYCPINFINNKENISVLTNITRLSIENFEDKIVVSTDTSKYSIEKKKGESKFVLGGLIIHSDVNRPQISLSDKVTIVNSKVILKIENNNLLYNITKTEKVFGYTFALVHRDKEQQCSITLINNREISCDSQYVVGYKSSTLEINSVTNHILQIAQSESDTHSVVVVPKGYHILTNTLPLDLSPQQLDTYAKQAAKEQAERDRPGPLTIHDIPD